MSNIIMCKIYRLLCKLIPCKDPLTLVWNQKYPEAKMKAEHGSRFSHLSNNAAKALKFFDELEDFCKLNPGSLKLRELLNLIRKHENLIKSELKSI